MQNHLHPFPKASGSNPDGRTFPQVNGVLCGKRVTRRHPLDVRLIDVSAVAADRFWAKVVIGEPSECWQWIGAVSKCYGTFKVGRQSYFAHRVSVALSGRVMPSGMLVDHICRNKRCVNPGHLRVATPKENSANTPMAERTHCRYGHEFTETNKAWWKGHRLCRICRNERSRLWQSEKRAKRPKMRPGPKAKLTEEQAREILLSPLPQSALAEAYGVNESTIYDIKKGRRFRRLHLETPTR